MTTVILFILQVLLSCRHHFLQLKNCLKCEEIMDLFAYFLQSGNKREKEGEKKSYSRTRVSLKMDMSLIVDFYDFF